MQCKCGHDRADHWGNHPAWDNIKDKDTSCIIIGCECKAYEEKQ